MIGLSVDLLPNLKQADELKLIWFSILYVASKMLSQVFCATILAHRRRGWASKSIYHKIRWASKQSKLWFICILCVSERLIWNKCLHLERVRKAISGMCMCVCVSVLNEKLRDLTLPDLKWHQTFTPGWASPSLRLGYVDILHFRTWVWTSEVDLLLKRVFFFLLTFLLGLWYTQINYP